MADTLGPVATFAVPLGALTLGPFTTLIVPTGSVTLGPFTTLDLPTGSVTLGPFTDFIITPPVGPPLLRVEQMKGPLIGILRGVDLSSTADQPVTMKPLKYVIRRIVVAGCDVSSPNAVGGIYTGVGKTGTAIVSASQAYDALVTHTKFIDLTLHASVTTNVMSNSTLYVSLTTPSSGGGVADLYVFGEAVEV